MILSNCVNCAEAGVGSLREQKNSKPEKCSELPQNPTYHVHALLDAVELKTRWLKKGISKKNCCLFFCNFFRQDYTIRILR